MAAGANNSNSSIEVVETVTLRLCTDCSEDRTLQRVQAKGLYIHNITTHNLQYHSPQYHDPASASFINRPVASVSVPELHSGPLPSACRDI